MATSNVNAYDSPRLRVYGRPGDLLLAGWSVKRLKTKPEVLIELRFEERADSVSRLVLTAREAFSLSHMIDSCSANRKTSCALTTARRGNIEISSVSVGGYISLELGDSREYLNMTEARVLADQLHGASLMH